MHNTKLQNAEFALTSTECNLRYILGDNPRNEKLIKNTKRIIEAYKRYIRLLKRNPEIANSCKGSGIVRFLG